MGEVAASTAPQRAAPRPRSRRRTQTPATRAVPSSAGSRRSCASVASASRLTPARRTTGNDR
ncbi:MAG: hypothetical protein AMK73_09820 [Planctomycetes bacterium SM23_32]|nr:MAG: hypothetical protein AMK73_09820 [Planctomycetes bacterium SM23_32]